MTPEQKAWIDNASYEQLLHKWRFAPLGDSWFQGECGEYYSKVMSEKRNANSDEHIQASKSIGWER